MGITVVPSAITGQTLSAAEWNTQVRDNINGMWVLTTAGDMLYATGSSAAARLALVAGGVLIGGASAPAWLAKVTGGILIGGASAPSYLAKVTGGILVGGASAPEYLAKVAGGVVYGGASGPAYTADGGKNAYLRADGSNGVGWLSPLYRRQGGSSTVFTAPGTTTYAPSGLLMQSGYKNVTVAGTGASVAVTYPSAFAHRPHIILSVELSSSEPYSWGLGHTDDTVSGFTAHIKFSGSVALTCAIGWLAITDE